MILNEIIRFMFDYVHVDGGIMITCIKDGTVKDITIPEFIDGYKVVKINDYLLLWLDDINLTIEGGDFKIFNRVIYNLIAVIGDDYIVKSGLNDLIYYFFDGDRKVKNFKDRW